MLLVNISAFVFRSVIGLALKIISVLVFKISDKVNIWLGFGTTIKFLVGIQFVGIPSIRPSTRRINLNGCKRHYNKYSNVF